MNLIIAEDDKMNARLLEQTFKRAGHQVVVAYDGVEALKAIREEQFGALVTDWMMPNMDGIELTREARIATNAVPTAFTSSGLAFVSSVEPGYVEVRWHHGGEQVAVLPGVPVRANTFSVAVVTPQ